jgi:hypothetical protein
VREVVVLSVIILYTIYEGERRRKKGYYIITDACDVKVNSSVTDSAIGSTTAVAEAAYAAAPAGSTGIQDLGS